jgi:hypothetical protein
VKALDPALNWTCGFSPDGPLECLDVASWHGFRLTDDGLRINSMMASCETHRARMQADYEHPMQSACGITGSRFVWPENFCYIEWGDDSSLTGAASVLSEATS